MGVVRGLIDGAGNGGSSSGRRGTNSIVFSQIGTCRHWPELQSQVHLHVARAGPTGTSVRLRNGIKSSFRMMLPL